MDTLILCGGFAKRLEPLTEFMPKPMLYINGRPLIEYVLAKVLETKPNRIIISTNKKFAPYFQYWMQAKECEDIQNLELVVEPVIDNEEKLGAIKGISYAIRNANLNDDLLVVAGDNYFDFEIGSPVKEAIEHGKPTIALYDIKSIDDAKMFGVVKINASNTIIDFTEKPEKPESTLISTGIYAFPKNYLAKFDEYLNSGTNPDSIGFFIEWLIKNDEVKGHIYTEGLWYDIGNMTTYRKLFYFYL